MKKCIIKEIEADQKRFGDPRRTLIEEAQRAVIEQKVVDEPVTVVISEKGWVRARTGHGHDLGQFTFKAGDSLYGTFECRTVDNLLVFASNGKVYSVAVSALPGARGDGVPITTLIELASGAQILHYFAGQAELLLLLGNSSGYGFCAKLSDMLSRTKGGKSFVTLEEQETLLRPQVLSAQQTQIACLSDQVRLLVFPREELKNLPSGGRGTMLMKLDGEEQLQFMQACGPKGVMVAGIGRGGKAQEVTVSNSALVAHSGKRGAKGKVLESKIKPNRLVALLV